METTITDTTTNTTPGTATLTDADLLGLVWLASPALPVGGFSYSEGLEAAVDSGRVTGEESAGEWLVHQLHLSLARADLAVIAQAVEAFRAGDLDAVRELDDWVLATRESSELRQQTEQMGRSLLAWLHAISVRPEPARTDRGENWTYPVAFALAASRGTAPTRAILLAFAFGWAENMVQAAVKSMPLGQSAGQRILARLAREIPAAAGHALQTGNDARQAFSPMLAILSAQHETQYSRLFRS